MITVKRFRGQKKPGRALFEFAGLSTDEKPTEYGEYIVANGSSFFCIDEGSQYLYDAEGSRWHLRLAGDDGRTATDGEVQDVIDSLDDLDRTATDKEIQDLIDGLDDL